MMGKHELGNLSCPICLVVFQIIVSEPYLGHELCQGNLRYSLVSKELHLYYL